MHPRDKSRLFHDLGELIQSGMTLPRAVERLATHAQGSARRTLQGISAGLSRGQTVPEALAGQPGINGLDAALFTASERAGKLDRGFKLASDYYAALAEARSRIARKAAYPLFIAHFAVIVFGFAGTISSGLSFEAAVPRILTGLAILWAVLIGAILLTNLLRKQAASSVPLDRSLACIPVIGGLRRDLALSRFSAAYDMQLEAGVNVFGALEASGQACASASYRAATKRALESVRSGETVSAALTSTRAFPERFLRAFVVGEETGRLDHELRNVSEEYRIGGLRKLEILSEWIPRMIFITVVVAVAWQVVGFYAGYLRTIQDIIK